MTVSKGGIFRNSETTCQEIPRDEGQFSLDDSCRIGGGRHGSLTLETVDTRADIPLTRGEEKRKNNSTPTLCISQTYVRTFLSPAIFTIDGWNERERERRTRERFRDRCSEFPSEVGNRAEPVERKRGGGGRKCINAARNVRDDEVAVYTLYRMHEIFGSRESPLLRRGKVYESPWKLTFFMDRNGPRKPRYIRAQPRLTSC